MINRPRYKKELENAKKDLKNYSQECKKFADSIDLNKIKTSEQAYDTSCKIIDKIKVLEEKCNKYNRSCQKYENTFGYYGKLSAVHDRKVVHRDPDIEDASLNHGYFGDLGNKFHDIHIDRIDKGDLETSRRIREYQDKLLK